MAAVKPKVYPAKPATGVRKQPLPGTLKVYVTKVDRCTYQASARRKSATGHSSSWAARRLADLLGYSKHSDVLYVTFNGEVGAFEYLIVEVQP